MRAVHCLRICDTEISGYSEASRIVVRRTSVRVGPIPHQLQTPRAIFAVQDELLHLGIVIVPRFTDLQSARITQRLGAGSQRNATIRINQLRVTGPSAREQAYAGADGVKVIRDDLNADWHVRLALGA